MVRKIKRNAALNSHQNNLRKTQDEYGSQSDDLSRSGVKRKQKKLLSKCKVDFLITDIATKKYYVVLAGRIPGLYDDWRECKAQIIDFSGARFKIFKSISQAFHFACSKLFEVTSSNPKTITSTTSTPSLPSTSTSKSNPKSSSSSNKTINIKQVQDLREGWDIVYTDGSCKLNGKANAVAGIGVWWGQDDPRNICERCPGLQTNNRAELVALIRVLETTPLSKTPLLIRTDSRYAIKCVESWIHAWEESDWRTLSGSPVLNESLIKYLSLLLSKRGYLSQKVRLEHVPGHRGIFGNECADKLAKRGRDLATIKERDWKRLISALEAELCEMEKEKRDKMQLELDIMETDNNEIFICDSIEQIQEGDLLSFEELEELGRTQHFE